MCGIVGAIAQRNVVPILLEGLQRLEYRGYDSAGLAVRQADGHLGRIRALGKVATLRELLAANPVEGNLGIAHTRWATHGMPAERNAHPHMSGEKVAVVHNGIIENHAELREELKAQGFFFTSETDTEVIAHLLAHLLDEDPDLLRAAQRAIKRLVGAYGLAVASPNEPDRLIVARAGSPLVIGLGVGENFIASDVFALLPVTQRFVFLEEGDIAEIRRDGVRVFDVDGNPVERAERLSSLSASTADKGPYKHYMLKEIFEQPAVIAETLEGRIHKGRLLEESFGFEARELFARARGVHIVACGTSYHAGLVARYWLEEIGIPCSVEVASEYRYRKVVVPPGTLFLSISQSGETADTLAALRWCKAQGLATAAVVNAHQSSMAREADRMWPTHAGPEIGVASTKAFTAQIAALTALAVAAASARGRIDAKEEARLVYILLETPRLIAEALKNEDQVIALAGDLSRARDVLYLGRGPLYPLALEGALKLKELSYIHAEGYAAGELKHGPIALVDEHMPVVVTAPSGELLEKTLSNLQEVAARGGAPIILITDEAGSAAAHAATRVVLAPPCDPIIQPMIYAIPIQLLAYHTAVQKGTDVDQPRNLAKSVTVE